MPRCSTLSLRALGWGLTLFALWPQTAPGVPVKLRAVEATAASAVDHPLEAAVDGVLASDNGWSLAEGQFKDEFAVLATDRPVSATLYRLQFSFLDPLAPSHLKDFGVSVTSDDSPALRSRWVPLLPESAVGNNTNTVRITSRTVRPGASLPGLVVTLYARAPFKGITGFRLRLHPLPDQGSSSPPSVGRGLNGNFLLTEFEVEAEPLRSSNIALGCQVYGSDPAPAEFPRKNLTDGLISTYSYPDPNLGGKDFFFTLDLGRIVALDHLVVRGRRDGGDSNRLGPYRIEILTDSKETRTLTQWRARMRQNGAPPSPGDADVIRQQDGEGVFSGRSVRVYSEPGRALQLQIAELEVYPALNPRAEDWFADDIRLKGSGQISVPAGTRKLSFTIASQKTGIIPALVTYRWRIAGWEPQWHEVGPEGRVELVPPPPGTFELQTQAQHTDGVWDQSGQSLTFRVFRLWWHDPVILGVAGGVAGLVAAAAWWRIYGWRMNRRLAYAEQHLELHRERLRIARDMHDEMGARLTYIALLADRTLRESAPRDNASGKLLERLAESARAAVGALDNIVWAVNPDHDTVGSLADYLCEYAPGYLQAARIECNLDVQVATPHHPLGLRMRHGLLMAVKEALQNAAKHSGATSVQLSLHEEKGSMQVAIQDNGCGLTAEPAAAVDHSGLDNMRQRIEELGGRCETGPAVGGNGTCVRFTLSASRGA